MTAIDRYQYQEEPQVQAQLPAAELSVLEEGDWARAFLEAYVTDTGLGTISRSAKAAGVTADRVKSRLKDDLVFRQLKELADTALLEALEYVLLQRMKDGTKRPIFQHGQIVGHVREVDNRLLQWGLERLAPEKYHLPTRIEHTSPDTPGAFTFNLSDTPRQLNPADNEEQDE